MHGEILELNDRLQRDLALKEHYITKLISTIKEAGLPVPVATRPQSPPPVTTTSENHNNEWVAQPRLNILTLLLLYYRLVSVWIPSVIKKGRGPDGHHIYQVFVRIGDKEWNVYRRYAEFREFHKQVSGCGHYVIFITIWVWSLHHHHFIVSLRAAATVYSWDCLISFPS